MIYFIYFFLILLFVNLGNKQKGGNILFRIIPCILFIALVGFRKYTVGVDSEPYKELFYAIPGQNYQWIEIGFDWLIRTLAKFGCEYNALYIVCISLTAIPIFFVLEKSESYVLSALMIYTFTLITVMNGMRQCIAVGIFILGSLFITDRKLLLFCIFMGVALLFHYSCIVLLPLYFVINKKLYNSTYTIIYTVSFIFCFIDPSTYIKPIAELISVLGRDFTDHTSSTTKGLSLYGFIYNSSVNIFIYYAMIKSKAFDKYPVYANCTFIGLVLKNMSFNMPIVGRIIMYFGWFPYLLIPLMIDQANVNKENKKLFRYGIFFLYLIGFVHNIFSGIMKMVPYEYCFQLFKS